MISPKGDLLASISSDYTIRLWDVNTRKQVSILNEPESRPDDVCFSPDGKRIAAIMLDGSVWVWDVETGILTTEPVKASNSVLNYIKYSPDGKYLMTARHFDTVKLWDPETLAQVGELPMDNYNYAAFSPDGKRIAFGDRDGYVYLWDIETEQIIASSQSPYQDSINDFVFTPDGRYFFSSGSGNIQIWNGQTGAHINSFYFGGSGHLSINSEGTMMLVSSNPPRIINIYKENSPSLPFADHRAKGSGAAFSPDGKKIAFIATNSQNENFIEVWDSEQMYFLDSVEFDQDNYAADDHRKIIFTLDWIILNGTVDNQIQLFDSHTLQPSGETLQGHQEIVINMTISPDRKTLASASRDGTIRFWDIETRTLLRESIIPPEECSGAAGFCYIGGLAFNPDGKILASSSEDNLIRFWDVETGAQITRQFTGVEEFIIDLAFSPDGKILASTDVERMILFWDAETMEQIGVPMLGHTGNVNRVLFNPDGTTLFSAGDDATIRIWDVQTQQPIGQPITGSNSRQLSLNVEGVNPFLGYAAHDANIIELAISPDGTKLISKDDEDISKIDGNIRIWDLDVNSWLEKACIRAGRNLTSNEWALYLPFEPYRKTCPQFP